MHTEEVDKLLKETREAMGNSIDHLKYELSKVRTGKASTSMVNDILVPYYGNPTPINQVANVTTSDGRTINIQPWEKNMLGPIEKVIFEANLGITPMNDGEMIRLSIPPLTEERRKELVKKSKALSEDAKIGLRQARQKAIDGIRKAVKDGYPEDAGKSRENDVQDLISDFTKKIEALVDAKEKDVMTV